MSATSDRRAEYASLSYSPAGMSPARGMCLAPSCKMLARHQRPAPPPRPPAPDHLGVDRDRRAADLLGVRGVVGGVRGGRCRPFRLGAAVTIPLAVSAAGIIVMVPVAFLWGWVEGRTRAERRLNPEIDYARSVAAHANRRADLFQAQAVAARKELAEFRRRFDRPRGDGGRYLPQSK